MKRQALVISGFLILSLSMTAYVYAQDQRLSTDCRLTRYSYPCLGYDMETAKRMVAEEDERRAAEGRKNAQEHDAKMQAEIQKKEKATADEKRKREQAVAEDSKRKQKQKAWAEAVLKGRGDSSLPIEMPENSKWIIKAGVSKFDDSVGVTAILRANDHIETRRKKSLPSLSLRCQEGVTALFLDWEVYISTHNALVEYRIDKEKLEQKSWLISTDYQATGLTSNSAIALMKKLEKAKSLLVRITPYGESPVATSFDLVGVTEVVANVRTACAW